MTATICFCSNWFAVRYHRRVRNSQNTQAAQQCHEQILIDDHPLFLDDIHRSSTGNVATSQTFSIRRLCQAHSTQVPAVHPARRGAARLCGHPGSRRRRPQNGNADESQKSEHVCRRAIVSSTTPSLGPRADDGRCEQQVFHQKVGRSARPPPVSCY